MLMMSIVESLERFRDIVCRYSQMKHQRAKRAFYGLLRWIVKIEEQNKLHAVHLESLYLAIFRR